MASTAPEGEDRGIPPTNERGPASRARGGDSMLAAAAARMHFVDRRTNLQIAASLGVSRFRVARLLEHALEAGIVEITINTPVDTDERLSGALRKTYDLTEALVLPRQPELTDPALLRDAVGVLAARYLKELCVEGMKVGVSWGKTLSAVASALELEARFPRCDVVQLVGNIPTLEDSLHAGDVLRRFTAMLRGASYPLNAPLIVADAHTASVIRAEESVARTLAAFEDVDIAVIGIGSWDPPSSRMVEVLPADEVAELHGLGTVADICTVFLDADGREVGGSYAARTISTSLDTLRHIPRTIGVAAGGEKADAVRAALASGALNAIVIDGELATRLLESAR